MRNKELYGEEFYKDRDKETRYAAKTILSIIVDKLTVNSCVDVGCGVGTWLSVMKELNKGCIITGLDGDYVNRNLLAIDKIEYCATDLGKDFNLKSRFDLAISLEVAEHLPAERAEGFVSNLIALSDIILFSAAFPKQGGIGHVNEQNMSYWVELFKKNGYEKYDVIRPLIYSDEKIFYWYRNNIVLFVKKGTQVDITKIEKMERWDIPDIVYKEIFDLYYEQLMREIEEKSIKHKIRSLLYKIQVRDK